MTIARYQLNTYVDGPTYEAVRGKASQLGVSQGDLVALYVRHAERTMKAEALEAWAASMRQPAAKGRRALGVREIRTADAIVALMRAEAPSWRFEGRDLMAHSSLPMRELYRGAEALKRQGLVETYPMGDAIDRWGKPVRWWVSLTDEGRVWAKAPTKEEALALAAQAREKARRTALFVSQLPSVQAAAVERAAAAKRAAAPVAKPAVAPVGKPLPPVAYTGPDPFEGEGVGEVATEALPGDE
jgi:hypothetical protein